MCTSSFSLEKAKGMRYESKEKEQALKFNCQYKGYRATEAEQRSHELRVWNKILTIL